MNSEGNTSTPDRRLPVMQHITPGTICSMDEDTRRRLEERCATDAYTHYMELRHIITHLSTSQGSGGGRLASFVLTGTPAGSNADIMDAAALVMAEVCDRYSEDAVFMDYHYQVTEDSGSVRVKAGCDIDPSGLADFIFLSRYNGLVMRSAAKSIRAEDYIYQYDSGAFRWHYTSKAKLQEGIEKHVQDLIDALGHRGRGINAAVNAAAAIIMRKVPRMSDSSGDAVRTFTAANPHLVQFHDLVLDTRTLSVAKMHPGFMLGQYHGYRIPTGSVDADALRPEDGFVPLGLTEDDARAGAHDILERMRILHHDEDMQFLLCLLGDAFHHDGMWAVSAFIQGGGGLGKSFFYNQVVGNMLVGAENMASIEQSAIDRRNNFTLSALQGKELNLVGEVQGSYLSDEFIQFIKASVGDRVQIERKFSDATTDILHAVSIYLSNEGKVPHIPSEKMDSGLARRIVIVPCRTSTPEGIRRKRAFTLEQLASQVPHFALLCIMVRRDCAEKGFLYDFADFGGASRSVIEGFTSKTIVSATRDYLNGADRFRQFACWLPSRYIEIARSGRHPHMPLTLKGLRTWLASEKAAAVNNMYLEFHEEMFGRGRTQKSKIISHLDALGIRPRVTYKSVRIYGEPFAEWVESVIYEDAPEELAILL